MDEDDPIRHELVIPIVPPRDGQPPEWRIVELQGEVERKDGGSLEDAFDAGQMEELPDVRGARGAAAGGEVWACMAAVSRAPVIRGLGGSG